MNIAMFAWEALEGLPVGGAAVYASRLAGGLAHAGHRVSLFTRLGPGQAMDEIVGGVHVRRCPWDRKRGFLDEIEALSLSFAHYFADARKTDGDYDIIHCHEWLTIPAGLRALTVNPAPLAVSFHSTEWGRTGRWPEQGDSARIAAIERTGVERAGAVVAASNWAGRMLRDQFHPPDWKCSVVYHGCDQLAPEHEPDIRPREFSRPELLFAGPFSRQGGGDLAARAVRLAAGRFPDARFVFVGSGPLEAEMRDLAGASAVFLPPRGRAIPAEHYRAADLVLAPFRRDHNGRAVLPAWAASRPVATLAGGVPAEFILHGTNGWVSSDDSGELAEIIMRAFADPAYAAWMGANGRTAVETAFTWPAACRQLLTAYARAG